MDMMSRRKFLQDSACGFGALAFSGLSASAAPDPLSAKLPHHAAKAKRVIFLFMQGGVSHVDSYDYKPRLAQDDGKMFGFDDARTVANTGQRGSWHRVRKPPWSSAKYAPRGGWASRLLPEANRHFDVLC